MNPVDYPQLDDDESFLVYMCGIELDRQIGSTLFANRKLRRCLRVGDRDGALFYLDALLRSTAAISRFFWPSGKKYRARGELLRRHFRVGNTSSLAARGVRNAFEHFDEEIQDWLSAGNQVVADANIGPVRFVAGGRIRPLRHLDPSTMTAHYLDRSIGLTALVSAVRRLRRNMRGVTFMLDSHLTGGAAPVPTLSSPHGDWPPHRPDHT